MTTHRFNAELFTQLALGGPGVYIFEKDGKALYVGMSRSNVFGRAASPIHHRVAARSTADTVIIYRCDSPQEAIDLESKLIWELRPLCNAVFPPPPVPPLSGELKARLEKILGSQE